MLIKGKLKGQLALEHVFGLCKTFEKIEKISDFIKHLKQLIFKIIYSQQKVLKSM